MCVVFIADRARPSQEMVEKGFESNPAGAGVAWREHNSDGELIVKWEKGLDLEEVKEYVRTMPLPFIAHFRIPSCGGPSPLLTHPFPITEGAELDMSGVTPGAILFHNGTWGSWRTWTIEAAIRKNVKLPDGKWSDTRAMAWMAHNYGKSVLEMIDEKTVVFTPEDIDIFGSGWTREEDVIVSNTFWKNSYSRGGHHGNIGHHYPARLCRVSTCPKDKIVGTDFCADHSPLADPQDASGKNKTGHGKADSSTGDKGGSSVEESFRAGVAAPQGGSAQQQEVKEGETVVRGGDGKASDEGLGPKESPLRGVKEVKLLGSGDPEQLILVAGDDEWPKIRRWVRQLQAEHTEQDEVERAKRRNERRAGFTRVGPI